MKFFLTNATVVGLKKSPSKDGTKMYYDLSLEAQGEVLSFNCTMDVFDSVKKFETYDFIIDYVKSEWNGRVATYFRLTNAVPSKNIGKEPA